MFLPTRASQLVYIITASTFCQELFYLFLKAFQKQMVTFLTQKRRNQLKLQAFDGVILVCRSERLT